MVTIDTIIDSLSGWVENKVPVSPSTWLDGALKITVLLGTEQEKLSLLAQAVAKKKVELIQAGDSVAKANAIIEASDEYRELKNQEAKLTRIEEMVRLAKIQARMANSEMGLQ